MADGFVGTAVPVLLLMTIGFLLGNFGILKQRDERVLSAYVYFFALPAIFEVLRVACGQDLFNHANLGLRISIFKLGRLQIDMKLPLGNFQIYCFTYAI